MTNSGEGPERDAAPGKVLLQAADGHLLTLDEIREQAVRTAVIACGGNIAEAARGLRISRSSVYRYAHRSIARFTRTTRQRRLGT